MGGRGNTDFPSPGGRWELTSPFRRTSARSPDPRSPRRISTVWPPPALRGKRRRARLPGGPRLVLGERLPVPLLLQHLVSLVGQVVRLLDFPETRGLLEEDRLVEGVVRVFHHGRVTVCDTGPGVVQP